MKITPEPVPLSISTWRLNQSRATALFVIPTTAGPTFLAAWTIGVLRASEIGAVGFSLEEAAAEDEETALCSLLVQPPRKTLIVMRQMPKIESGER